MLPNGYIHDGNYYFYIRDHLGNNRVVVKEKTLPFNPGGGVTVKGGGTTTGTGGTPAILLGTVVQRTDYYPSGLPFPGGLNPEQKYAICSSTMSLYSQSID